MQMLGVCPLVFSCSAPVLQWRGGGGPSVPLPGAAQHRSAEPRGAPVRSSQSCCLLPMMPIPPVSACLQWVCNALSIYVRDL